MTIKVILAAAFISCVTIATFAQDKSDGILYVYATKGINVEVGTGFFINGSGTFATAYHVVSGATSTDIFDRQNRKYSRSQLIAIDPKNDVAILTVNTSSSRFFPMADRAPHESERFTTIGHPWGFRDQIFQAHATQSGYAESIRLSDSQGHPIFSKSIEIIPLDMTIYNGMSGAPIIDASGDVVGMLSGSFNVGGSIAWGIPAKQILSLINPMPATRTDLANVIWRPMESVSAYYKSFTITRSLSISETIDWLNSKWQERGIKEVNDKGFIAHIEASRLTYDDYAKSLILLTSYNLVGKSYKVQITVALEDAQRATAAQSPSLGYHVIVECPKERSCTSFERQIWSGNVWKTAVPIQHGNSVATEELWEMVDKDGAARAATAINYLIQLHGGPVIQYLLNPAE